MRFGYSTLLAAAIGFLLLEVAGWNLLAYSRLSTAIGRADPLGQLTFIFLHPLNFTSILIRDIWRNGFNYLVNWIAIYGYAYWPVPTWTYYLYIAGLIAALFSNKDNKEVDKKTGFVLAIVFFIAYLATIISLYITFTPIGSDKIDGVQGRYFLTVMPLLFLALACLPIFKRIQLPNFLPLILATTSLILYTAGMYLSYHVPCGSQYYQAGLCYQPNYKNWAPDEVYSQPLSNRFTLTQEIVPECNGLTELRVWIDATGADINKTTNFVLTDVNGKQDILNVNIPNSELPSGNWFPLNFQPDWNSNSKFYLLTIRGDQGPRVAYSLRPEYPAGKLFENDQAIGQDMIFQTGCKAGWEKIRLTNSP
jgi:hypothetical protein